jgi:hypothetical protein
VDGLRCIDLSGVTAGTIAQTINGLVPGQAYHLSFMMAANPEAPPPSTDLLVTVADVTNRFSVTQAGTTTNLRWTEETLDFVATSETTSLRFASLNPGWAGPVLDALTLTPVGPVAPTITSQPQSRTVIVGDTATFSVGAAGNPAPTYQWRFNDADIADATNATLTLNNVRFSQAGDYAAVVSNPLGSVTSAVAVLTVNLPPPTVRVVSVLAGAGGEASVPVQLLSQGNENALGFSLNFNTALLAFTSADLGADAPAGATMFVNDNQASAGKVGLAVGLPANETFSAGTQHVVVIHFTAALMTTGATATITFGDVPTARQISDAQAHPITGVFTGGSVSITPADFEGDVAPRPGGDRSLTIIDWVQLGRFAAGIDTPDSLGEFQRADCAPRATGGNGVISVSDVVQAGRYAVGLDPLTPVGGPTEPGGGGGAPAGFEPASVRTVCLANTSTAQGQTSVVPVTLEASGNENAVGFSVKFDAAKLSFSGAANGAGATNAALTVNANQATGGVVGVIVALPPGSTLRAGTVEVLKLSFVALAAAPASIPVRFGDQPVLREVSDVLANPLSATYTPGTVTVTLPSGPPLQLTRSGDTLFIRWPSSATGFALEATAGPLGTAWSPVTGVVDFGDQKLAVIVMSGTERYFRLKKP